MLGGETYKVSKMSSAGREWFELEKTDVTESTKIAGDQIISVGDRFYRVVPWQDDTHIFINLYDETDDSLSNVVDVYVANLRRKVGRDLVRTHRGQGYIIE